MTNTKTKAEKEPPAQAHFVGAAGPCGFPGQLARSRAGGRTRRRLLETTLAPRWAHRGEGMATSRSRPGPTERGWRQTGSWHSPPVYPGATPNQALFPSALVALPSILRPRSSLHFFPGGRVPTQCPPLGPLPGSGEPPALGRSAALAAPRTGGPRQAQPAAPGFLAQDPRAQGAPPRTAALVLPLAPGTFSLAGGVGSLRSPIADSRARPATLLGLPWGWRLSSHRAAGGQRPGWLCPETTLRYQ